MFTAIKALERAGIFSATDSLRNQAARELRNTRSHLENRSLKLPQQGLRFLHITANLLNRLFAPLGEKSTNASDGSA